MLNVLISTIAYIVKVIIICLEIGIVFRIKLSNKITVPLSPAQEGTKQAGFIGGNGSPSRLQLH